MTKKILILGVAIIMALGLFAGCGGNNGKIVINEPFYSLQAAYNEGLITKKDLKTIADFHKNGNTDVLDDGIANEIKAAYFEKNPQDEMTADDVVIDKYYGTYNDCVAVMIGYLNSGYTGAMEKETIAGVRFGYNSGQKIVIWKNNK